MCDNLASRPEADLNNAMLRFAMDITGHFIFAKDYGATRSFDDANTDDMLSIMKQGGSNKFLCLDNLCTGLRRSEKPDTSAELRRSCDSERQGAFLRTCIGPRLCIAGQQRSSKVTRPFALLRV